MNKKNIVLYEAANAFYTVGCPVQLIKYQIVRKPNSADTFARLVFGRKSKRRVRSVVFDFRTFDGTGATLDTCTDQCISADRYIPTFDGATLFPISSEAQLLRLKIKRVIFEPQKKLRRAAPAAAAKFTPTGVAVEPTTPATSEANPDVWISQNLPLQKVEHFKTVTEGDFSVEAAECLADVGGRAKFDYRDYGSSWLCSCGMLNDERERCAVCHAKKSDIENAFKPETLEERRRSDTYESAVKTAAETRSIKTVNESIGKLTALGDYKDSPKQIEVCKSHIKGIKKAWTVFSVIMAVIVIAISALMIWFAMEDNKVDGFYLKEESWSGGYTLTVSSYGSKRDEKQLEIPATYKGTAITTIGEKAFSNSKATSVTLPSTITTIESDAFAGSQVSEVHFDGTLAEWSAISFGNPSANPASVGAILYLSGDVVVDGELRLPDTVTEIGNYAFCGWKNVRTVRNLDKVKKIGNYAFSETSLETADVSSVTSIGTGAFYATPLDEIVIPDGVTWFGEKCFPSELKKLSLPSLRKYESASDPSRLAVFFDEDNNLLSYYKNGCLEEVTVRGGALPEDAFSGFEALTTVTFPSGVTKIPERAFQDCSALTSISIPSTVTTIGKYAFWECKKLSSVLIPSSVKSVGYGAFLDCASLSVYYDGNETQWKTVSVDQKNDELTQNLYLYSETEPASSDRPLWHRDNDGASVKYDMKRISIDRGMTASDKETMTMKVEGSSVNYLEIRALTGGTVSVRSLSTAGGVYGYLYDANKKSKLASSEPSYYSYNSKGFEYTYSVKAGTTYYIGVKNDRASYSTKLNVQIEISGVQIATGESNAAVRYYKKDETVSLDAAPTRNGYEFLGWYTNGSKITGDSVTADKDREIVARWHKLASVTLTYFKSDNSQTSTSVSKISAYSYQLFTVRTSSSVSISLSASSYGTAKIYDSAKSTVKKELTLSYSSRYSGTMTVTLSSGDYYLYTDETLSATITSGSAVFVIERNQDVSTKAATEGEVVTLPTPTRSGYIFTGWTLDGRAIDGTTYTVPDHDVTLVATWTDKADLTLIYDNGTEPTTIPVTIGRAYNLPTDIVKAGATFDCWRIDLGEAGLGTDLSSSYTMPNHAVTLRATWSDKANLTLIYDNGETETETVSVTIGESYALPSPEKAGGYEFLGWYVDLGSGELGDKIEGASYEMPDRHVTLRATWPKDVTITLDEGDTYTTSSSASGSRTYHLLRATNGATSVRISLSGGSSSGRVYLYAADRQTVVDSSGISRTRDWDPIYGYTYSYYYYAGSLSADLVADTNYYVYSDNYFSATISSGSAAFVTEVTHHVTTQAAIEGHTAVLPKPTRAGYSFAGWTLDGELVSSDDYTVPDHNVTLRAKWCEPLTLSIYTDSEASEPAYTESLGYGESYVLPNPTRSGYVFLGWYYNGNHENKVEGDSIVMPDHDVTLVGAWSDTVSLTLIYDDGSTEPSETSQKIGTTYNLSAPIRAGYYFFGWYVDNGEDELGEKVEVGSYTIPNHDVTLRAVWGDKMELTLIYDNGVTETAHAEVDIGSPYPLPTPEKNGYCFLGWYVRLGEGSFGDLVDALSFTMPPYDLTLQARWTDEMELTLIYDDGVSNPDHISVIIGDTYYLETAMRAGYEFLGWFIDDEGVDFGQQVEVGPFLMPAHDVTLRAAWTNEVELTLIYDEENTSHETVLIGDLFLLPSPANPQRLFLGWFLDGVKIESDSYLIPDHNVTLYASWSDTATLTWVYNNGDPDPMPAETPIGSEVALPTPEKADCEFLGWFEDNENPILGDSYVMPNRNVTLWARYALSE